MDRELKVVITIFLVFFIYGLSSIFTSGGFVTFYFLNQLVLFAVSILFYVLNFKLQKSYLLLFYVVAQSLLCLVDGFTVGFLASKYQADFLVPIHESVLLSFVFIGVYFSFFGYLTLLLFKNHKKIIMFLIQMVLLVTTIIGFFSPDMNWMRDLAFITFALSFVVVVHRFMKENQSVFQIISYQLILLVLLESLEFFQ